MYMYAFYNFVIVYELYVFKVWGIGYGATHDQIEPHAGFP